MTIEEILEKIANGDFKNCLVKLKFDKNGKLQCILKEEKLHQKNT